MARGGGTEGEREMEEGRGRGMLPYTNQLASTLVMYKFCMPIETDCAQSEVWTVLIIRFWGETYRKRKKGNTN